MDGGYGAVVVAAGAAANLPFAAMFLTRVLAPRRSRPLGFAGTAMALPLPGAALGARAWGASAWLVAPSCW